MSSISAPLRLYLRLAFGICWGVGLLMLLAPQGAGFLQTLLWFLAVGGAPGLAALVAARSLGRKSLAAYFARIRGLPLFWCLVGPAILLGLHALAALGRGASFHWPGAATLAAGVIAATIIDPGPLEEFGWRGFLQPLLQNSFGPLASSLLVGVVWGLWHLPVLIIPGFPQHDTSLPLFLVIFRFVVQTTALSVLMGFVLNRARGAVAPAILMHWAANQGAAGHVWPFDQTAWTITVAAAAALIALSHLSGWITYGGALRQET